MPKEFNLDDYKYTEEHILFSEWRANYQPMTNHVNVHAKFDGTLFEHTTDEWDHVCRQPVQIQWTLIRQDDGRLVIKNGLAVKGRLGYFLTGVYHNAHSTIIIDFVPEPDPDLNF